MEEVPCHDPRAGRASGTPDCFTLLLAGHLAGNARFSPLAKMLTAQPCQGMAEKVSPDPLACTVLEVAGQSRPSLQANETESLRDLPSFHNKDHYQPMLDVSRERIGQVMRDAAFRARIDPNRAHPHALRHTYDRNRVLRGVPIAVL